jgi:hypothetical protein
MEGRCFKKTGANSGAGTITCLQFKPALQWGSCCPIFSFHCIAFPTLICLCVFFLLTIVSSVFLCPVASYYPFCIFKLFQANVSVTYRINIISSSQSMVVLPEIDGSVDIDSFVDIDVSGTTWIRTNTINSCAKSAWYAHRQHSYNICKDFLSHNSWMKNLNFTNSCTINMNWNIYTYDTFFEKSITVRSFKWMGQGVLNLQRDIWNFTKKYTDRQTINSNNSVKFEVNWPRGS